MRYDYKTGMFDLSDTKTEKTYNFSLKNTLRGGGWHGECKIRYCPMCGRDLLVK